MLSRRGVVGFALNPTSKGPKGIADMGCKFLLAVYLVSDPRQKCGRLPMYA